MTASADEVRAALLALDTAEAPYSFAVGEDGDVVGTWDYADAKWAGFFAAGTVDKSYSLTVTLHDDGTYTLIDRTRDSESKLGSSGFHYEANAFRGTTRKISFNRTWAPAAEDHGAAGNTYGWDFDTDDLKKPVLEVLARSGWTERKRGLLSRLLGR